MTAAAVPAELLSIRQSIDNIDAALVHLLAERFKCTQRVGHLKADQGLPPQSMYQRSASAPCRSNSSNGSSTLPGCLLILRPSPSRMCPRQSTVSYDERSNTSVPTVMSV